MPPSITDAAARTQPCLPESRGGKPTAAVASGRDTKRFRAGTHRALNPQATLDRVRPFLPEMGITRIANVTGLDYIGIPVVMVCRPNSRSLAVNQGKGLDLPSAKASGVMEAIECWHAERIAVPLKYAGTRELSRRSAIADVDQLPRVEGSRFDPDFRLPWIGGYDLMNGCPTWLPYELVHTDYTSPKPAGSGCFLASTNGLASGNTGLEAVSHGICEVIERDALALLSVDDPGLESISAPLVDLESVEDPACRNLIRKYENAEIEVAVWDMTTDIGVPCFFCRIAEPPGKRPTFCRRTEGAGCHPTREIAMLRALSEAAQSRLTIISGARDDIVASHYGSTDHVEEPSWPFPMDHEEAPPRCFGDIPTYDGETFAEDVDWLLTRLRSAGIEQVVVADLTRPEFEIPVVRVVIPGLEGFSLAPSYSPGRRAVARRNAGIS